MEFVALMVVAAPLVQVEAQVTSCLPLLPPQASAGQAAWSSHLSLLTVVRLEQMDDAVDELFLNVTPLHRSQPYIQRELNKLQLSVSKHPRITTFHTLSLA